MPHSKRKHKHYNSAAMELPNEIIEVIISHVCCNYTPAAVMLLTYGVQLDDRQDILALTRICRKWSLCAIRNLYKEIQLTVSHDCKTLSPLENLISSSGVNLEPTRGISILPKHTSPYSDPSTPTSVDGAYVFDGRQSVKPVVQPPNDSLNLLIRVLLGKIPKNSLKVFAYVPPPPLCLVILD